jgi:fructokinase
MAAPLLFVGLGEALFDVFPDRRILGGAPLNVAVHAHQLAAGVGGVGVVASRVGDDDLGRAIRADLATHGMPTGWVQIDARRPTGQVRVTLQGREPTYDIVADVAWDHLAWEPAWADLAAGCAAVCFGTLAQRGPAAAATIRRFLDAAPQAVRLFDVNLRQEFYAADVLRAGLARATAVKLNEQELPEVAGMLGLIANGPDDQAEALRRAFGLRYVVLTRGARGTMLYTADGKIDRGIVSYPLEPGADSVGAGDACSAGLLVGLVLGWPPERAVDLANRAGAFVASRPGATPILPEELRVSAAGLGG